MRKIAYRLANPRPRTACRAILPLLLIVALTSACGHVDCTSKRQNFNPETKTDNNLGMIYFKQNVDDREPAYAMSVNKIKRGYALQAPVYSDESGLNARLAIQKDKEYKTFSGLQISYEF